MKVYMISQHKFDDMYHLYEVDMEGGRFIHVATNTNHGDNKMFNDVNWDYLNWNFNVYTEEDIILELI